jgi:hypothetical protein
MLEWKPFLPETSINKIPLDARSDNIAYSFHANLAFMYKNVFPDMNNYDIEDRLWERGVISEDDFRDSEFCEFVVYFNSFQDAESFINRLNTYISKKISKFEEALNF